MDRYRKAIAGSSVITDDAAVAEKAGRIFRESGKYAFPETYKFLLNSIDLTSLSSEDNQESIRKFTEKVNAFDEDYPQYGHVASICVYSNFAELVASTLDVTGVGISAVAGGFPSGQAFTAVKVADVALATAGGATEIDVVMNPGMFLEGDYENLSDELIEMRHTAHGAPMKVILETGALKTAERIRNASIIAMWSEADFIKTSTGKIYPGASPEAALVMCESIKEYHEQTGRRVGFKVAGGIRTVGEALGYYAIVKEVLGSEWLENGLFRIGASSLANKLLSVLEGKETNAL